MSEPGAGPLGPRRQAFEVPVRSLLFVPGDDEDALAAALQGEADAVVADLEDLVARSRKAAARATVADLFSRSARPLLMVRVNTEPDDLARDLEAVADLPLAAVVVPKAVPALLEQVPGHDLVALVESAAGVRLGYELAIHPQVVALAIGLLDLSHDLGLPGPASGEALAYIRGKLVVDCAAAGLAAPYDVPSRLTDLDELTSEAQALRALGMGGKICRTAEQVAVVNDVFT